MDRNIAEVEEVLRTILGDQLDVSGTTWFSDGILSVATAQVPASLISGGSPEGRLITTVERNSPQSEPLVQVKYTCESLISSLPLFLLFFLVMAGFSKDLSG